MEKMPEFRKSENNGIFWEHSFTTFKTKVYVPEPKPELKADILNYGFLAPYLLVFTEKLPSDSEAINFAKEKQLEKIAKEFASSVVYITPVTENWNTASPDILSEIISNSRIHEYYENGVVKAWNRFTNKIDGYFIRGAIFRICLFGFNSSADYIAKNCLKHFEGDGLWGRSDLAPACCILSNLSVEPQIEAADIPVISYENSAEINQVFTDKCDNLIAKPEYDFYTDFYDFAQSFRRMNGPLNEDPDLLKDGLVRIPELYEVNTSADNFGDDKGTIKHKIGYFTFYNQGIIEAAQKENRKLPLVLGFHGGGDSCFFFSIMAGWAKICHRHNFILVTIENHLNSTATEMIELIDHLKKEYPVDEKRIYATGFSMGGIKTWDLIQEYPEILAAAAPMDATVDIGENVYFRKIDKPVNYTVSVPVFYAAGEVTPLPELPCQEQKCINRAEYILKLNKAVKEYDLLKIKLEKKDQWENKFWGINGDQQEKSFDPSRNATLTMEKFKDINGIITTIFASISEQGHDCREHTCEHAWQFMSKFSR